MFRDYGIYLNQENDPLPPRDDVTGFDARTKNKELGKNLKLQGLPSELQDKVKEVVT